jgi:hypothetical protein
MEGLTMSARSVLVPTRDEPNERERLGAESLAFHRMLPAAAQADIEERARLFFDPVRGDARPHEEHLVRAVASLDDAS